VKGWIVLVALLIGGCGKLDREAVVLMIDEQYRPEILLANADGIASPDGLLWSNGRLYIADEGGSAVRSWAPGERVRTLADARAGLSSPEDLALTPDGTLYVSDDDTGGVWRIDGDGAVRLAPQVTSSEGLVLAPSGDLLIGDPRQRRIVRLGGAGQASRLLREDIGKAESFAFDESGRLYIADNDARILYLLSGSNGLRRPIEQRSRFSPESLHYGHGALFITDSDNGRLYRFTPEDGLRVIAVFGGSLANIQGITSDESGNLYVSVESDLANDRGYILRLARRR
jgi:gluconolactonase